jgi:hypothetical protein
MDPFWWLMINEWASYWVIWSVFLPPWRQKLCRFHAFRTTDPVSHLSEIIMLGNQPQLCYQFVAYTGNNEGTSLHESKPKKGSTMALISNWNAYFHISHHGILLISLGMDGTVLFSKIYLKNRGIQSSCEDYVVKMWRDYTGIVLMWKGRRDLNCAYSYCLKQSVYSAHRYYFKSQSIYL